MEIFYDLYLLEKENCFSKQYVVSSIARWRGIPFLCESLLTELGSKCDVD